MAGQKHEAVGLARPGPEPEPGPGVERQPEKD